MAWLKTVLAGSIGALISGAAAGAGHALQSGSSTPDWMGVLMSSAAGALIAVGSFWVKPPELE